MCLCVHKVSGTFSAWSSCCNTNEIRQFVLAFSSISCKTTVWWFFVGCTIQQINLNVVLQLAHILIFSAELYCIGGVYIFDELQAGLHLECSSLDKIMVIIFFNFGSHIHLYVWFIISLWLFIYFFYVLVCAAILCLLCYFPFIWQWPP